MALIWLFSLIHSQCSASGEKANPIYLWLSEIWSSGVVQVLIVRCFVFSLTLRWLLSRFQSHARSSSCAIHSNRSWRIFSRAFAFFLCSGHSSPSFSFRWIDCAFSFRVLAARGERRKTSLIRMFSGCRPVFWWCGLQSAASCGVSEVSLRLTGNFRFRLW